MIYRESILKNWTTIVKLKAKEPNKKKGHGWKTKLKDPIKKNTWEGLLFIRVVFLPQVF